MPLQLVRVSILLLFAAPISRRAVPHTHTHIDDAPIHSTTTGVDQQCKCHSLIVSCRYTSLSCARAFVRSSLLLILQRVFFFFQNRTKPNVQLFLSLRLSFHIFLLFHSFRVSLCCFCKSSGAHIRTTLVCGMSVSVRCTWICIRLWVVCRADHYNGCRCNTKQKSNSYVWPVDHSTVHVNACRADRLRLNAVRESWCVCVCACSCQSSKSE